MTTSDTLGDCERILESGDSQRSADRDVKTAASSKIAVLSEMARIACSMSVDPRCPTYCVVSMINAVVDGVDLAHKLLRQVEPDSDSIVKQMADVKKGAFRCFASDVTSSVDYKLPAGAACIAALRVIVHVLKDMKALAES